VSDRSVSGHSVGSILKAKLTPIGNGEQMVEIEVNNVGVGRTEPEIEGTPED
jgi:hypothetical protein